MKLKRNKNLLNKFWRVLLSIVGVTVLIIAGWITIHASLFLAASERNSGIH